MKQALSTALSVLLALAGTVQTFAAEVSRPDNSRTVAPEVALKLVSVSLANALSSQASLYHPGASNNLAVDQPLVTPDAAKIDVFVQKAVLSPVGGSSESSVTPPAALKLDQAWPTKVLAATQEVLRDIPVDDIRSMPPDGLVTVSREIINRAVGERSIPTAAWRTRDSGLIVPARYSTLLVAPSRAATPETRLKPSFSRRLSRRSRIERYLSKKAAARKRLGRRKRSVLIALAMIVLSLGTLVLPSMLQDKPSRASRPRFSERTKDIEQAIARGGLYLLDRQGANGSWQGGYGHLIEMNNTFSRTAITAMSVSALEELGLPESGEAIDRGLRYIEENMMKDAAELEGERLPATNNFQPYAQAYGLSILLKQYQRQTGSGRTDYAQKIRMMLQKIGSSERFYEAYVTRNGASVSVAYGGTMSSFQLGLLAESLLEAKALGFEMPRLFGANVGDRDLLNNILDTLEQSRLPHGGYPYYIFSGSAWTSQKKAQAAFSASEGGSAARSVLVDYVLFKAGRADAVRLRAAIDRYLEWRLDLQKELLQYSIGPHRGVNKWAQYYYLFGLYWTSRAIRELPDADRVELARNLAQLLLHDQLDDGSWVDSWDYAGPNYGTASAMLALRLLQETIEAAPNPR